MLTYDTARAHDAEPLAALSRHVASHAFRHLGSAEQLDRWLEKTTSVEVWSERITLPHSTVFTCSFDGQLVGCGWVAEHEGLHHSDCYFGGLYVAACGLGIGTELTRRRLLQAGAWQCRQVLTEVVEGHRLVEALARQGFEVRGEHAGRTFTESRWLELVRPLVGPVTRPR